MDPDEQLLEQFIGNFENEYEFDYNPPPPWKRFKRDKSQLQALYKNLPFHFPPLYESLLLNYSWQRCSVGEYRVVSNAEESDFSPLLSELSRDAPLFEALSNHKHIQFGNWDAYYDPLCFAPDGSIVLLDHEQLLLCGKYKLVRTVSPDIRTFIQDICKTLSEQ